MPSNDILFYIGRHGRTQANSKNIYRSLSNAPEAQLSELGRQDAKEMGEFFSRNRIPISVIICDELDRTHETALIVAKILGIKEVYTTPRLHPLDMGDLTLKSKEKYPVDEYIVDPNKRIPGGDTLNEFNDKQVVAFQRVLEVAQQNTDGFVLAIGHGSNISFLYNHLYNSTGRPVGYEGLVDPGGVCMATDSELVPITNIRKQGKPAASFINIEAIKGEPGTGFEKRGGKGPFECGNCEYFKSGNSCHQKDMMKLSKQPRHKDGSVVVDAPDCCEYVERVGEEE